MMSLKIAPSVMETYRQPHVINQVAFGVISCRCFLANTLCAAIVQNGMNGWSLHRPLLIKQRSVGLFVRFDRSRISSEFVEAENRWDSEVKWTRKKFSDPCWRWSKVFSGYWIHRLRWSVFEIVREVLRLKLLHSPPITLIKVQLSEIFGLFSDFPVGCSYITWPAQSELIIKSGN